MNCKQCRSLVETAVTAFIKNFCPAAAKKGCCHVINDEKIIDGDTVYCGEGYATCVSIYNAVHDKTTHVIFCGDAGNLESVTGELRNKFPRSAIIIGGDADQRGWEAAHAAAGKFGCAVVFPAIPREQINKSFKDFNDVEQKYGTQRVKDDLAVSVRTLRDARFARPQSERLCDSLAVIKNSFHQISYKK